MVAKVIELPDELQRRIEELSRQIGRDEADLVRDAITTYIDLHDVPRPKSDGTIDDPCQAARDIDDWLAADWRPE
jgi:metal-responsive CopG/Arc/MetJ family transcriptional regulator